MRNTFLYLAAASLTLSACGSSDDAPEGQVAATVNGEEITVADINMEMGGASSKDPAQQKAMRDAALQSIINRQILAQAAENEEGVGDTPTAAMITKKATQLALIELLQQQARANVPKPSMSEARQYVTERPEAFAQRKIYTVDQLIVPRIPGALVKQMEPLDTLDQIKNLLKENNVDFTNSVGTVDSLAIPAAATKQIDNLKPGEVFVVPERGGVRVNRLRNTDISPISGETAEKIALQLLTRQRINEQVKQRFDTYITAGKEKVKYNKEFEPAEKPANSAATPAAPGVAANPAPAPAGN